MPLGPYLRKPGTRAGISAVSSRLSRWQLGTSFTADPAHGLQQPRRCPIHLQVPHPSASAPSQAVSFSAITLELRAQKNWPTPAVGFCISVMCATRCSGFYTAQTWLPIGAWCVDRTGAQQAGEPSAAPRLPDFQQHGWTCCCSSSQPEQGNV